MILLVKLVMEILLKVVYHVKASLSMTLFKKLANVCLENTGEAAAVRTAMILVKAVQGDRSMIVYHAELNSNEAQIVQFVYVLKENSIILGFVIPVTKFV